MPTNDQDARALTYLAGRLRAETHGCREWDESGIFSVIKAELVGKNLAHALEVVLCHATDTEAKTPGAMKRPFVPPKPSQQPKGHPGPLKASEQCRRCGGPKGDCHCTREHLAATYDDETPAERIDREAALQAARDAIHAAKGGNSSIDREEAS